MTNASVSGILHVGGTILGTTSRAAAASQSWRKRRPVLSL